MHFPIGFQGSETVRGLQKPEGIYVDDSAPSRAGKRKRQGEEGPRQAKRALMLREE